MAGRIGSTIKITIKDLAFDGKSIGDDNGKIVFLNAGLPGEKVTAEIIKSKARYDVGRVIEIVDRSDDRITARCSHFGLCGGCTWQDLAYDRQLYYKHRQIKDCLAHIGKIENVDVAEPIPVEEQFHYRNKMEFSFNDTDNDFVLGLHRRGYFDEIFNLKECFLQSETASQIVGWFREFVRNNHIPIYDVFKHTGFMRFLMIRQAYHTGQIMVNIVTTDGDIPNYSELVAEITSNFPEIAVVVQNINNQKSNIAKGEKEKILYGEGYIEEKLFDYKFRIYANTFFQTNSRQTENLYRTAFSLLKPSKDDRLLDLYCGTGTIGISASRLVNEVVGIELEPSAIKAAKENVVVNNIENVSFYTGSVQDMMKTNPEIFENLTCVIIDPPRAGLHKKAIKRLAGFNYPKLVYISCNPSTFARDASILIDSGYRLDKVIPVDMFPHTMHIELAAGFYK